MQVSTCHLFTKGEAECLSYLARKFHELNQAYEALLDPLRRLALNAKLRLKQARLERYKTYDNKRKAMLDELEAAEQANKKARVEKQKEEVRRWQQTEQIKEEGRRMKEEKERELKKMEEDKRRAEEEMEAPSLGELFSLSRKLLAHFACRPPRYYPPSQVHSQIPSKPDHTRRHRQASLSVRANRRRLHRALPQATKERPQQTAQIWDCFGPL